MDSAIFQAVYETILQRDTRYDGIYYTGIKTTGISCRPSCKSRTPKKENVQLFESLDEAISAGFRPCKRCKPEQIGNLNPDGRIVQEVKMFLQKNYAMQLTLQAISREMVISPYHLQRVFKRTTGITPAQFLLETRLNHAKALLNQDGYNIAEIAKMVGFRSVSHFSMVFKKKFQLTPSEFAKEKRVSN